MTTELYWLSLTLLMTALFWVPYVLDRIAVRGLWATLSATPPAQGTPQSAWAQRAREAHYNAIENLVIFAAVVLVAHALKISTQGTQMAVKLYFFARLAHFVVYTAGIPAARTVTFTAGWIAQIILLASVLGWI